MKKKTMNLKDDKVGLVGGFREKKGKGKWYNIVIFRQKKAKQK